MLNVRQALRKLDGKCLPLRELWTELDQIRTAAFEQLPVEFGTHELFAFAQRRGMIKEDQDGRFLVLAN